MTNYDPPIENPVQAEILELEDRIRSLEAELAECARLIPVAGTLRERIQILHKERSEALKRGDRLEADLAAARQELANADSFLVDWSHEAGWSTGHGDTVLDILREMKCDQREEIARRDAALAKTKDSERLVVAKDGLAEINVLINCSLGIYGLNGEQVTTWQELRELECMNDFDAAIDAARATEDNADE